MLGQFKTSSKKDLYPISIDREMELLEGTLIKRYKRFMADIELNDGRQVTAHCVNTGRMEGLTTPGTRVWVSPAQNPNRKLKFTWELAEIDGEMIGTNTGFPNQLVRYLLSHKLIPFFQHYDASKPEHKIGPSHRVDFLLTRDSGKNLYLEVKNCHLVYPDRVAYFPDSVSERATKHVNALVEETSDEVESAVLFLCQIPNVISVKPSDVHDPVFAEASRKAAKKGLEFYALSVRQTLDQIFIEGAVPVDLTPYPLEQVQAWKQQNDSRSIN